MPHHFRFSICGQSRIGQTHLSGNRCWYSAMEDKYLGDATQQILGPLVKYFIRKFTMCGRTMKQDFIICWWCLLKNAIKGSNESSAWLAWYRSISINEVSCARFARCYPRDWSAVVSEIHNHFDPHFDFVLLPKVPLDTLDFTSFKMELGSKMIIDATKKQSRRGRERD